ncbi:uncharacterized protein LOC144074130 isoform X5 [Stigmatopora argus]
MDDYLRRVDCRLGTQPSLGVCVPLLCGRRSDAAWLPRETLEYLHKIKVCESHLLWKDDLDLIKIHRAGKLSVTLLRNGLLESSELHTLDSSILRVVHHHDDDDDICGMKSAAVTVATELLQEAPERVGAALRESLGEALRLQSEAYKFQHGHRSEQLDELQRRLEWCSDSKGGLQGLEHLLSKELKEFSDGETTIALTSVIVGEECWFAYEDALKSFCNRHGYDGLMLLLAVENAANPPRLHMVVCSNNMELVNQICCELEQTTSWSLSRETGTRSCLRVYQVQLNAFSPSGTLLVLLEKEVRGLLKEFVDRRSSLLACRPSSRTSSTEGVAGSVEFSQGSSGINDMDTSDTERADGSGGDPMATESREAPEGEDDPGEVRVSGELVSPDSGMNTIRSSRSSKESSVFLSDDSPVAEIVGSVAGAGSLLLRNSPLGLLSLSPPVPPERRRCQHSNKKKNDSIDQFHFDPLHPHYVLQNSAGKADEEHLTVGSSSPSEYEELNMVDFSHQSPLGRLESRKSSIEPDCQIMEMMDTVVPPTPVNSLVGGHSSSSCGARFFPEDVAERIVGLQHKDSVSSSLSETWEELGFDTPSSNDAWTRIRGSESPRNLDEVRHRESDCVRLSREGRSQRDWSMEPQLSLITEQTETCENWKPDSVLVVEQWNSVSPADLQLTPPEEDFNDSIGVFGVKKMTHPSQKKKMIINTLTPETSKEENDDAQQGKARNTMQTLDFWTYSAQKGFLKSDSVTTTSYPESLDLWNTTIRDDSISPLMTPDNSSEDAGNFGGTTTSMVGSASVESPQGFPYVGMEMWNTTIQEDSSSSGSPEAPGNGKDYKHPDLEDANDTPTDQRQNVQVIEKDESRISDKNNHELGGTLSVPRMVISISDYDNLGSCNWTSSAPEIHCDPMIQLEEQSSPFISVAKPIEENKESNGCTSDKIFLFEGKTDLSSVEKNDSIELCSPFILVDNSQTLSQGPRSNVVEACEYPNQTENSLSRSPGSSSSLVSSKAESSGSVSPSNSRPQRVSLQNQDDFARQTMSPSPGIDGETLKFSPGSRDELRSNSDGDSSSCLEMEYILVPGTVNSADHDVKEAERQSKRLGEPMETFEMLSYAVSVLKAQNQETHGQSGPTQNDHSTSEDQNPEQSTNDSFLHSESRPPSESEIELEGGPYEDKSSVCGRSISPSLRHPSDHFLRTREEVYVHSQISMEDSGSDSGHSPINNSTSPHPDFQVWGEPLETQDSSSCNSSAASHTSSLVSTPVSEAGVSSNKTLGLPFSGDLMEEENKEGQEEEAQIVPSSYDLLSFTEELVDSRPLPSNSCPIQQDLLDFYGQSERTDDCLVKQHDGECWDSRQSSSQNLECQNTTSQILPYSADQSTTQQWTMAHGPSVISYNYHHVDQRTGNQEAHEPARNASSVYAEFSIQPPLADFAAGQNDNYFEPCNSEYKHYVGDDHVQYVPKEYAHFLMSRREHHEDQLAVGTAMTTKMMVQRVSTEEDEDRENREDPSFSADVSAGSSQRRKLVAPPMNVSLEHSEGSPLSEDPLDTDEEEAALDTGDDLDVDIEELDTSEEECDTTAPSSGGCQSHEDSRVWRIAVIGEQEHRIDMKCIEAYKRVISHGGYYAEQNAIIVFAACFLPDSDCDSYNYVMENLFLYVISTLELMVAEDYMIVYLNGATPRRRMPGFTWMKKCYQMIDRRLKKNLKMFIIVHPSWFIRTLLGITRPFISSKFSSKIKYVSSLQELGQIIPMEYVHIPPSIIKYDQQRVANTFQCMRLDTDLMDASGKSDKKKSLAI